MDKKKKSSVLVAMSGGVDSAAALIMLAGAGYDVTGVTFFMHGTDREAEEFMSYADGSASYAAKKVAFACGVPHIALDKRAEFKARVTDPFVGAYAAGETPNPCVVCNKTVKFRELLALADEMNIDMIATGHYSHVTRLENGRYTLRVGKDAKKDQTYMLYTLPQEVFSRLILPLGGSEKSEIRELVSSRGVHDVGAAKDSQDICFIPDGDYAAYMESAGFVHRSGDFIDGNGKKLGRHRGFACYTRGQRKGLGIALGRPMFVNSKDHTANTVTLTDEDALFSREVRIKNVVTPAFDTVTEPFRATAKIRYTPRSGDATVYPSEDGIWTLIFDEPQRAATKGQHCVFYGGDTLLGGGEII